MSDGWRATRGAIHARAVAGGRCCSTWAGGVRARVAGSEKGVFLDVGACGAHGREEWVAVGSRKDGFGQLAGSSDRWAVGAVCVAQRSARVGAGTGNAAGGRRALRAAQCMGGHGGRLVSGSEVDANDLLVLMDSDT